MRRKLIPPFLMLFVGAITSIIMWTFHYETKTMLLILLGVLIAFYIIGCLLKWMLDLFDKQNEVSKTADEDEKQLEEAAKDEEGQVNS
ncbi:MAG: SoxR reducing system RseC family protein [Clostridiales bacterium]|nr:SoxR reducing system RseC family protein [Clostridiales bacterium]